MILPNESKNGSNVSIRIERLVLDGFKLTPHEQSLFRAALETELARRFAGGDIELGLAGAVSSLPAQSIPGGQTFSPPVLGQEVGAAVFGALKK